MRFKNKASDADLHGLRSEEVTKDVFLDIRKDIVGIRVCDDSSYNVYARSGSKVVYLSGLGRAEARALAKSFMSRPNKKVETLL